MQIQLQYLGTQHHVFLRRNWNASSCVPQVIHYKTLATGDWNSLAESMRCTVKPLNHIFIETSTNISELLNSNGLSRHWSLVCWQKITLVLKTTHAYTNHNTDQYILYLPVQVSPSSPSMNPGKQSQLNDPMVLMHSCVQSSVPSAHSFISEKPKNE